MPCPALSCYSRHTCLRAHSEVVEYVWVWFHSPHGGQLRPQVIFIGRPGILCRKKMQLTLTALPAPQQTVWAFTDKTE